MIGALSFVPIADTVHAFTGLSNHVGDQDQVILVILRLIIWESFAAAVD